MGGSVDAAAAELAGAGAGRAGNELGESIGEVFAATEEHLLNLKSVKTYNNEERDVRLFGACVRGSGAAGPRARRDIRRRRTRGSRRDR